MSVAELRVVTRELRRSGLIADPAAVKAIAKASSAADLANIIAAIKSQRSGNQTINEKFVMQVLGVLNQQNNEFVGDDEVEGDAVGFDGKTDFEVLDAFRNLPSFQFVEGQRVILHNSDSNDSNAPRLSLFAPVGKKSLLLRQRYTLIHQRIMRHSKLQKNSMVTRKTGEEHFSLTPVASLIAKDHKVLCCLFGMLVQIDSCKFAIEDLSGMVELDISKCNADHGSFVPGCFVLAEGRRSNNMFEVFNMGFPPPEPRSDTLAFYLNLDFCKKSRASPSNDGAVLFFSDFALDDSDNITALFSVLDGLESHTIRAIVIMGNLKSAKDYSSALIDKNLSAIDTHLKSHYHLLKAKVFLVPGPNDLSLANVYPKYPSRLASQEVLDSLPNFQFVSNPFRIIVEQQEITVFRKNILNQFAQNSICFSDTVGHIEGRSEQDNELLDLSDQVVRTLIQQSHMLPFSLDTTPVYWNYDHALYLYPLPHLFILGEDHAPFSCDYANCKSGNPGSFHLHRTFMLYDLNSQSLNSYKH